MTPQSRDFLLRLLTTPSPSGFEAAGQRVWAAHARTFASRVENDAYGNAWATLDASISDAPTVMLAAHADEIGFMVQHVTEEGFIHVVQVGGSDRAIARGRRVRFLVGTPGPEDEPKDVLGVIGNPAIHLREKDDEKIPKWEDLVVDIGASSRDEVLARGLRVGIPAVYADGPFELTEKRLGGRALDNRIGGFIIAEALRRLAEADERPEATVRALNTVQEEIGGNGATMASYRLRPEVAVVVDVTHATDTPGLSKAKHGSVKLGGGPTLTHGTANHPAVVARLIEVAEREDIPIQHEASSRFTGTDTDSVFVSRSGIPSALVSLPMRYMHSPVEVVDLGDVEHAIRLLAAFAASVRQSDAFGTAV
jgi:endoglucanase